MKRHGVGLVVTEMVSAYGILYENRRTLDYLSFREEERPLSVQLFGDRPETLEGAARVVLEREPRPDILDLNLGCPVRKVMKTGSGSALAGNPGEAARAAAAMVRVASEYGLPVTAKIRSGPNREHLVAPELARALEAAGVAAIAVHPRTVEQQYSGAADHGVTGEVVRAVSLPVVASGDVGSYSEALRIVTQSGAQGVMLARGVQGNPWLVDSLLQGRELPRPSLENVVEELRRLLWLAVADMGPARAARWIRRHIAWYLRPSGVPGRLVDEFRRLDAAGEVDEALSVLTRRFRPA
jgi:nifR3 family TIM-barrel protein